MICNEVSNAFFDRNDLKVSKKSYLCGLNTDKGMKNDINDILKHAVSAAVAVVFGESIDPNTVQISATRKEFVGDMTIVCFPFSRISKGLKPPDIAAKLGEHIGKHCAEVSDFNVVQGFLNLSISDAYWHNLTDTILATPNYGQAAETGKRIIIEFSSPNTNKPLHLGHVRNILLGWSTHNLLKAAGNEVLACKVVPAPFNEPL